MTLPVTFVALTLNTSARAAYLEANRRMLPELRVLPAVDGFDKNATIAALCRSGLRYHLFTYCGFTKYGTYGSLANFLTKVSALAYQVRHQLPVMAMLEDDMRLKPGFQRFVHRAASRLLAPGGPALLQLGDWGEGYVTELSSASMLLGRIRRQGVPLNVDIFLNDGHAGMVQRLHGTPWEHHVGANLGDCLKTAHIALSDLPSRCVAQLPRPVETAGRAYLQQQRARYCRSPVAGPRPGAGRSAPWTSRSTPPPNLGESLRDS